ncbi:MAG: hypothetical protein EA388_02730 [Nitriliruptor sp.]|nr:MAG: hypothetical protein EA388_02730 [Nitriliruptor sp.]
MRLLGDVAELEVDVATGIDRDELDRLVTSIAEDIDHEPRDATLGWTGEGIELTDEVERTARQPAVTTGDDEHVLLLHLDRREVQLYRDGEVVRAWPVAVGQPSNPTPTGVFTVGAKRIDPTWTNPAPDGWGADLPEVVGPGPDNPMGPRALNWNRDGRDTPIRFHGTRSAASSRGDEHRTVERDRDDVVRGVEEDLCVPGLDDLPAPRDPSCVLQVHRTVVRCRHGVALR